MLYLYYLTPSHNCEGSPLADIATEEILHCALNKKDILSKTNDK